jgi:hypothetical protein
MAENFFTRFVAAVAPEQPATGSAATAETGAAPGDQVAVSAPAAGAAPAASVEVRPNAPAPEAKKDIRLPPALWVTGLAAIIGAMLYFFTGRRVTR